MSSTTTEKALPKHDSGLNGRRSDISRDFDDLGKAGGALAGDTLDMVQKQASQYYDQGLKQAKRFEKGIESRIQKHPLQSLLIVAGVGLLLGALWNRR